MKLMVGTLTRIGGAGIGYVSVENDKLDLIWSDGTLKDPNWLAKTKSGRWFAVSSNGTDPMKPGCIHELRITSDRIQIVSSQPTEGAGPCHMAFSEDERFLVCAQYTTGSLAVFPLFNGSLGQCIQLITHTGNGPHPSRQTMPHMHQVTRIPTLSHCFCAVDLGIDALVVYEQAVNGMLSEKYRISVPAGQGPRHIAYAGNGNAYLVTEIGNCVYPVIFEENAGEVVGKGVSTLEDLSSVNLAAALWTTPDDEGLLVSNRGEGTIVRYAIPSLEKTAVYRLPAKQPRDFCILDDQRIVAACQDFGLVLLKDGKVADALPYIGAVRVLCIS